MASFQAVKDKIKDVLSFHDVDTGQDIRYRGPLSYRYFRIIAWALMIFTIGYMSTEPELLTADGTEYNAVVLLASNLYYLAIPLMLIAVFAVILNGQENYTKMIILYSAAAILVSVLFIYMYERIALGIMSTIYEDRTVAKEKVLEFFSGDGKKGFVSFNIFIDILLCVFFMFFLLYTPKKIFTGKKIIIFRCLSILPLAYEVICIVLKICAALGYVRIPPWSFPLLTTKPPLMFLMFVVLALFVKIREHMYMKKRGATVADYRRFLNTNRNSLQFALFLSVLVIVFSVADTLIFKALVNAKSYDVNDMASLDAFIEWYEMVAACGFGKLSPMKYMAPLTLLFSYTRKHKVAVVDMIVPVAGMAGIVLVYVDYLYRSACTFIVEGGEMLTQLLEQSMQP